MAVHRLLLRTARTPLRRLWALGYRVVARLGVVYLVGGQRGAAAYVRAGLGDDEVLPGLSDVDVVVVFAADPAAPGVARDRASRRWQRLRRVMPLSVLLFDWPRIYDEADLRDLAGSSALTYGLDGPADAAKPRAGFFGPDATPDRVRMLERPGLYGATVDWRLLAGPDRRPPQPPPDAQRRRVAAWLELVYWWQWVSGVCIDPTGPRTAQLCVKLVAEPARIWLWLAHGERPGGRVDALQRALRHMPEEEEALRRALHLYRSLPDAPPAPLAEVLPVLVRLSARIAALIAAQIGEEGATEVRLADAGRPELVLARGRWRPTDALAEGRAPRVLPLCDWRALVCPPLSDDAFAPLPGDPGDPVVLGAAAAAQEAGPYPGLRSGGLLILPAATRWRTRLRAIQCAATDPVSHALLVGEPVARFPDVRGWSAPDTARRAVAEHRAALATALQAAPAAPDAGGHALSTLLTAARAALFLESIAQGDPELALTVTETARRLAARSSRASAVAAEALGHYREFALHRVPPPPGVVAALRRLVLELPGF